MKSLIKKLTATIAAFSLLVVPLLVVVPAVHATDDGIRSGVCEGISQAGDGSCEETDGENNFGTIAKRVINIFSIVVGAVSVIMIIIGGFRYIISGGDSNSVTGAKNTIMYAIIGLVIVLFAQIIVRFVFSNVGTGE